MARLTLFALPLALVACGGSPDAAPAPATPASVEPTAAPSDSRGDAEAQSAEPAEPTAAQKRPLVAESLCADVVTIGIGQEPNGFEDKDLRHLPRGASVDIPRNRDGNQRVWLLDDKGEGLIKVEITRGMKRIEVGRSCRTLDAR